MGQVGARWWRWAMGVGLLLALGLWTPTPPAPPVPPLPVPKPASPARPALQLAQLPPAPPEPRPRRATSSEVAAGRVAATLALAEVQGAPVMRCPVTHEGFSLLRGPFVAEEAGHHVLPALPPEGRSDISGGDGISIGLAYSWWTDDAGSAHCELVEALPRTLRVQVLDAWGDPVEGANVYGNAEPQTTDARGRAIVEVFAAEGADAWIAAYAEGLGFVGRTDVEPEERFLRLVLAEEDETSNILNQLTRSDVLLSELEAALALPELPAEARRILGAKAEQVGAQWQMSLDQLDQLTARSR